MLVIGLMFMVILAMLGITAVVMTTTDMKIGGNYKANEKAFYAAEAGAQEARERLRLKPDTDPAHLDIVSDELHTNAADWTFYIGTDEKTQKKGYNSGNPMDGKAPSLQTGVVEPSLIMEYTVVITHQVDGSGAVLYWGDSNGDGDPERHTDDANNHPNIYLITSYGSAAGANNVVQIEVTRIQPIPIEAALYTGIGAKLNGNGLLIDGNDMCGGSK